ncbi:hypothetical protein KP509_05G008100 [Ceratopteris richardii]|uniref:Potassium transporter n=1 Tax=Ceratopteris richardii TaxID=49495 RepID=A0A8T2URI7_CERRI|nr:hypothetical protein KP509_05G008100 [Ceratopteris richardii]
MAEASQPPTAGNLFELNMRLDQPLDAEAEQLPSSAEPKAPSAFTTLRFAFQSLGIVYGDLGTSPLYVYHSTFPDGLTEKEDLMGALSLIIYLLLLIPLLKYTFIVMKANDNGQGGTFSLYSLICRHARVDTIPSQHWTDRMLTTYQSHVLDEKSVAGKTKHWLEENTYAQKLLVLLVLFGTSMLIGDGLLTPAISVLSSVGGIQVNKPQVNDDWVLALACIILVLLFSVQRFGTGKVGWFFAPAVFVWFLSIGLIGIYNIVKHDPVVLKAFLPTYIFRYFQGHAKKSWVSLGGILLSITGTEALYADVGHFTVSSVQIAFPFFVLPCLLASYVGQAAYLSKHPGDVTHAFYRSIPEPVYWPMFVVATVAAIIASQATITATFATIKQAVALGCFPRVKLVFTSSKHLGQVYIPEINWILMVLCIIITAGFRGTIQIGNAYGIAVVALMLVTTMLMILVMLLVWRTNLFFIILFATVFMAVELVLLSSVLFKFKQGGWAPLVIGGLCLAVMFTWHYGMLKKYEVEQQNKVPVSWILGLGPCLGLVRVPGIGFIYSELAHGVPSIFSHFMTHLPAIHAVVVFVCVKYLPVNIVPEEERFLFRRIGPKEFRLYRCVARYGYRDLHKRDDKFEDNLISNLSLYIMQNCPSESTSVYDEGSVSHVVESPLLPDGQSTTGMQSIRELSSGTNSIEITSPAHTSKNTTQRVRFAIEQVESETEVEDEDVAFLQEARRAGIVHILGDVVIKAKSHSNIGKKFLIDYMYALLQRICRENSAALNIPHENLLNVGQVYFV